MCKPRNDRVPKPRCFAIGRHALSRLRLFVARGPRADRCLFGRPGPSISMARRRSTYAHRCARRGGSPCRRPGPWSLRRPRLSTMALATCPRPRSEPPRTANGAVDDGVNRRDGRGWEGARRARSRSRRSLRHGPGIATRLTVAQPARGHARKGGNAPHEHSQPTRPGAGPRSVYGLRLVRIQISTSVALSKSWISQVRLPIQIGGSPDGLLPSLPVASQGAGSGDRRK